MAKYNIRIALAVAAGGAIALNLMPPGSDEPKQDEALAGIEEYCLDEDKGLRCFDIMEDLMAELDSPKRQHTVENIEEYCLEGGKTGCYDSIGELLAQLVDVDADIDEEPQQQETKVTETRKADDAPSVRPRPRPRPVAHTGGSETYNMGGKVFTVSAEVSAAFQDVEAKYGIPYNAMVAACGRESDCDESNINPSSKACGLFQLMTNNVETLYEATYKYARSHGYPGAANLVERYVSSRDKDGNPYLGYRPVSASAKTTLINDYCLDAKFNAHMWAAYQAPKVAEYNRWLGNRTITAGELTAMNNLGLRGMQLFTRQAWKDKATGRETLAVDFFKAHENIFGEGIASNRTLIHHENGNYKTVRESLGDVIQFGGYARLERIASVR